MSSSSRPGSRSLPRPRSSRRKSPCLGPGTPSGSRRPEPATSWAPIGSRSRRTASSSPGGSRRSFHPPAPGSGTARPIVHLAPCRRPGPQGITLIWPSPRHGVALVGTGDGKAIHLASFFPFVESGSQIRVELQHVDVWGRGRRGPGDSLLGRGGDLLFRHEAPHGPRLVRGGPRIRIHRDGPRLCRPAGPGHEVCPTTLTRTRWRGRPNCIATMARNRSRSRKR